MPTKGNHHSPETRARIGAKVRAALTGRKLSPRSPETRAKIGDAHRGKVVSAETRAKVSAAMTGRKVTPQTLEKMRTVALEQAAAGRGLWSPEARAKAAASRERLIGVPLSAEHRAKVSASMTGGVLPEDIKAIVRDVARETHYEPAEETARTKPSPKRP